MDTQSQHLIVDMVLKKNIEPEDIQKIKKIINENFTVVERVEHQFSPHGETIVFILAESHFTLHTYPEHDYISFDIYVCNPSINLEAILIKIKEAIGVKLIESKILERGGITQTIQKNKLKLLYLLTVVVAMGSILYELLLAQALSTTMGNTALRYNVTIGIYIASMGFGALFYKKLIKETKLIEDFLKIEMLLSFIGGLSPMAILIFDYYINKIAKMSGVSFYSSLIQLPIFIFNHSLIIVVGFISGLELPLLMNIGKKISSGSRGNIVLGFDYLGTLLGAILFPIFILPSFNIFHIGFLVSFLNIIVTVITSMGMDLKNRKWIIISVLVLFIWLMLIYFNAEIASAMINRFYFGGKF